MNPSWLTSQHLLYAVPVVVLVGLLLLKTLVRLVLVVVVVVGAGFLVLGPTGAHLPPDVQPALRAVSGAVLALWRAVRGLTG